MRILSVRFRNLNSLTGEWHIDFTHPDYESNGIFAITGPTGAGKTTVLDAVCLGLYGRTPRLDRVTKSGNDIMSRQTGECFSEVAFETQKGRYRCHWSQHRARRRPDGELQQAKHEISDAGSGKVLESRIAEVSAFVEKVTGMNFERFTRSMLLAQGGFAVFLQAPPGERAPILEQITGTEIYSRISVKVHQRRGEEHDRLDLLQAELKGIPVRSEEEEEAVRVSLKDKQSRDHDLAGTRENLRKARLWLDTLATLGKEIHELDNKVRDYEERRQAFQPESIKLGKSRKALGLEGDYSTVNALRAEQGRDVRELNDAVALEPEKDRARQASLLARRDAEIRLAQKKARQASEGEVIRKVRDLDTRLGERKTQVDEKDQAIRGLEKQGKTYRGHIEKGEKEMKLSQTALAALREYRAAHAADAALPSRLPLIGRGLELLRDTGEKHGKACEEHSAAAKRKASALAARERAAVDHEKSRREWEEGRRELEELSDDITAALGGREAGDWLQELETLRERERLLVQAGETAARIDGTVTALKSLRTLMEEWKTDRRNLLEETASRADQKGRLEKDVAALETQVSLLNRIRDLEEERKRLEDGRPCPLCGATDHPFAKGNVPVLNVAEADLKKTKDEFRKASDRLNGLESKRVQVTADIGHAEKEMAQKKAVLDAEEMQLAVVLSRLNIRAAPEERAGILHEALTGVRAGIAETSGIVALVEEKGKKEKASRKALEKRKVKFDDAGRALQDAGHRLETASLEHDRLMRECAALAAEIQKARDAVLKDVEPFGVDGIPSDGLDAVLKDLTGREASWREKENEKNLQEKRADEWKASIEKYKALLANLEEDLAARRKDRDSLKNTYDALLAERRELFGEKNAGEEEKRLTEAVDRAGRALEKAREEFERIEKEKVSLTEKIASLKVKTGNRARELAEVEGKLMERIRTAGFEDEADYRASRLGENERELLEEKEKSLIREKTELEARRKDRSETLAMERAKNLTDQSIDVVQESMKACDAELRQIGLDIGGLLKSLNENAGLRDKKRELLKKVEAGKKECARWDDLHQLIGSADGKKFRNFAQGLTFEIMITQANRQLMKMTDRYLLVHDPSQPLELNVIDNYQAGEIRSTKNLSGGESFIVSLALALGLSQMASRNVRVDSLFLDEGFGTLDEEALETALEALVGLRQDGKLIGVISHVTAVRERIGTQIQVVPGTGGRSLLTGPGCFRI